MTVISTRNVARARAMEVDPRSPFFLSIVFRSRNLDAPTLRPRHPVPNEHPDNRSPYTRTAHHIHPWKKFNTLLQKLRSDGRPRNVSSVWTSAGNPRGPDGVSFL